MYRFWKPIIEPIFSILKPRVVVEIGSDHGNNTKSLLEYCQKYDATLHSIDPLPKFDVSKWSEEYKDTAVFHVELSLNALPKINRADAVLIDGDHNWYTVFHELKLIEKSAKRSKHPFPLVLLHDIGWPYGRRDLYCNPDNIPEAYRKPYKKLGIKPGNAELVEQEGLNPHLYNAIYENDLQNGVLTAVEDFIENAKIDLELIKIPAISGLGILFPVDLRVNNPDFRKFMESLQASPAISALIEQVESARINSEVAKNEIKKLKGIEVDQLRERGAKSEQTQRIAENRLIQLRSDIETSKETLIKRDLDIAELTNGLAAKDREKAEAQRKIEDFRLDINNKNEYVILKEKELERRSNEIQKLARWIEKLDHDIEALRGSWRWKLGATLVRSVEMFAFRKRVPIAIDHMQEILRLFKEWRLKYYGNHLDTYTTPHAPRTTRCFRDSVPKENNRQLDIIVAGTSKQKSARSTIFHRLAYEITKKVKNNNFEKCFSESEADIRSKCQYDAFEDNYPLVSIIMPTYNRSFLISEAIESIREQTYQNWELLVCDDGSTDDTAQVVSSIDDPRITYIKLKHEGSATARNRGLENASGSIIAYLDTDNIWHPEYLKIMVSRLHANSGQYCVFARYIDVEFLDNKCRLRSLKAPPFDWETLKQKNFIDLNSFVHRAALYDHIGGFTDGMARQQDWDLIIKYTYLRDPISVDNLLVLYRRNKEWGQLTVVKKHETKTTEAIIARNVNGYLEDGLPSLTGSDSRHKITIISWDICRNHFSKAYNMAECLSRDFDVQLIGFRFFEDLFFPPYKGESPAFDTVYLEGTSFPEFRSSFAKALASIKGDIIYAVKPRLPSLGLALLANYHFGKPFVLEINDLESVVSNPSSDSIGKEFSLEDIDMSDKTLLNPYSDLWSKIMESLAQEVPVKVTHNTNLNEYFGGDCFFIRNLKDEQVYNPEKYDRAEIRKQLGFSPEDRIILFGGMLRKHKGIYELLELINRISDPRYKLLFVGSRITPEQKDIVSKAKKRIRILPPTGRNDMAKINLAADVVIVWLDPNIPASHYQMPYKLTDAFAMKVPVIANDISDMGDLGRNGYLRLVDYADFSEMMKEIERIFEEREKTEEMVKKARRLYQRQFSYNAALANLHLMCDMGINEQRGTLEVSKEFADLFSKFSAQKLS